MTTQEENKDNTRQEENKKEEKVDESRFWDEAKESVSEGAKVVGEEAKKFGDRISAYSEKVFGKISDSASDVYKISTEFTREAVNKSQALAEKYKDKYEVNKLNNKKKEYATQLGIRLYLAIKNNDNQIPENFIEENDIKGLISKLEGIDKEIIDITKEDEKAGK